MHCVVLLDLLETTPKFPSKLDDWNALCVQFNERTTSMGFQHREGKSLRKKWWAAMHTQTPILLSTHTRTRRPFVC